MTESAKKRTLILHVPVIHKGFLDFLERCQNRIDRIHLLSETFLFELTELKPDIASIDTETSKKILASLGFYNVQVILDKYVLPILKRQPIMLISDEISRNLYNQYLQGANVEWASVFLRWDKESVFSAEPAEEIPLSDSPLDVAMMQKAYEEAAKSSDWWRQVGAVLVKNKEVRLTSYNQGVPSDYTPYQQGAIRDLFQPGERHDLSNSIHAEQLIVARAAREGISLEGSSLYVTHFPCPWCAKTIAFSGIKNCYFKEGGSHAGSLSVLQSAGISVHRVLLEYF